MSVIRPPLLARMTAIRALAGCALAVMIAGSAAITRSSAANPSGSRYLLKPVASVHEPRSINQPILGRITSAQISIISPEPKMPLFADSPRAVSHSDGSRAQSEPATCS